jgi:hypothetical protein
VRWRAPARQIAAYRGPQQKPGSELEPGRGLQPEPVQRHRRCRRLPPPHFYIQPPAKRIAPKVPLSVRIASEARRDRPHGHPSDAERAGRGERGGAWRDTYHGDGGQALIPRCRRHRSPPYPLSQSRWPAEGGRDSEWRASTNACIRRRATRRIVLAAPAASAGIDYLRVEVARPRRPFHGINL